MHPWELQEANAVVLSRAVGLLSNNHTGSILVISLSFAGWQREFWSFCQRKGLASRLGQLS